MDRTFHYSKTIPVADHFDVVICGGGPDGLSITKLTEQPIPEDWNEQRRLYGFPER